MEAEKTEGSEQPQRQPVTLYMVGGDKIRTMGSVIMMGELTTSKLPFPSSGPQAEFICDGMDRLGLIQWSGAWLLSVGSMDQQLLHHLGA